MNTIHFHVVLCGVEVKSVLGDDDTHAYHVRTQSHRMPVNQPESATHTLFVIDLHTKRMIHIYYRVV